MKIKRILAILAVLVLVAALSPCGMADSIHQENRIIREMTSAYCWFPDASQEVVAGLLDELKEINPDRGEKWEQVMNYWKYVNDEMEYFYDELPNGLNDSDGLCIIVLGFELNWDGSMKDELIERLDVALRSAEKYPNAHILCTGGGTALSGNDTEATQMAKWLKEHGIEDDRIIVEDKSLTTAQNAKFSREILRRDYPEIDSVAVITSDYHLPWGIVLFGAQFALEGDPIKIVSNAVCEITQHDHYQINNCQRGGILEIAGLEYFSLN